MNEVVNCLEGEVDILKAVWDVGGSLKAVKTSPSVPLPRDPEELRQRISFLGRAWAFVALSQPNCKYLQGGTPQLWAEYLDYLPGPFCFKLRARDASGNTSAEPPWNLLLSYGLESCRKMVELMVDEGTAIDTALPTAYKNSLTKERFFITPLAVGSSASSSSKRPFSALEDNDSTWKTKKQQWLSKKGTKGKGKGKGNGGGKGKQGSKNGCAFKTPDGKNICFAFNTRDQARSAKKCKYLHVCGRCFKDHPLYQCSA